MVSEKKVRRPYTWREIAEKNVWLYLSLLVFYHVGCFAALYLYAFGLIAAPIKLYTIIWAIAVAFAAITGVTAGAHRLWSHRSYKANLPLRLILMVFYSAAGLNSIYHWARDHRVHHKYVDTDADPYSSHRGFFFSHYGWVFMKRHPECVQRNREVDMSDVKKDGVVMFQKKYFTLNKVLFCFVVPAAIPVLFWQETILHAVLTQCFLRYVFVINSIFCINSVAHFWGDRPYDKSIYPAENILVNVLTGGEGSHNYHHTFPWDYKAAELPWLNFNTTTLFIDAFAKIGWAWDLRKPSQKFIDQVVRNRGEKSEPKAT